MARFIRPRESSLWLGMDALRSVRQGPAGIEARQRRRLAELVDLARGKSPYYRELYRNLPDRVDDLTSLPVTDKPALMAYYDEWATDRDVTMDRVQEIADFPHRI